MRALRLVNATHSRSLPERRGPMNSVTRRIFLIAAAIFALILWTLQAGAQRSEGDELKRVIELYQEGKLADATSLAQKVLAIYEKAFGRNDFRVATALNN